MSSLITLNELKTLLRVAPGDTDATRDAAYTQAISWASSAVSRYADRHFGADAVTEQRTFEYDDSGFLDIDDASSITAVTFSYSGLDSILTADQWRAEPYGQPGVVYSYLVLPSYGSGISPEMGFTRNLDVVYREGRLMGLGALVKVDGTWGWVTVPDDVKMAVAWTAVAMSEKPQPYQSESIANYSYSQGPQESSSAIPERAKELLAPYVRIKVA